MPENTRYDADAIIEIGGRLQSLMADYQQAFEKLKAHWPNAGSFSTAEWLETVVGDRRDALVQHADRFNMTLDQMGSDLRKIGKEFESVDGDNAADIAEVIGDGRTKNEREVNEYSLRTEEEWGNFKVDEDSDTGDGDGDGYDNNTALPGEEVGGSDTEEEDEDSDDDEVGGSDTDEDSDEDSDDDGDEDSDDDSDEEYRDPLY